MTTTPRRSQHATGYADALGDVLTAIDREVGTTDMLLGALTWIADNATDTGVRDTARRTANRVDMDRAEVALAELAAAQARTAATRALIAEADALTGRA
jgi:hypothetical protein